MGTKSILRKIKGLLQQQLQKNSEQGKAVVDVTSERELVRNQIRDLVRNEMLQSDPDKDHQEDLIELI